LRRVVALALPLLAAGCSSNLTGEWVGQCHFLDDTYDETSFVTVDIEDGRGNLVEGTITVDMFDDRTFSGPMDGIRSDIFLEMDATFSTNRGLYTFHVDSDIEDDDEVSGTCTFGVPGGPPGAGLSGELTLER